VEAHRTASGRLAEARGIQAERVNMRGTDSDSGLASDIGLTRRGLHCTGLVAMRTGAQCLR
jgi:hypothetical protein